jgi:bifunctional UDP-N-acetylglucosamine pyrophosphorylase/glucosamine-1-phosphate N-acetyltransferase
MSRNEMDLANCAAIVMAGGLGTRMKSKGSKSMQCLCGRPIIAWILDSCEELALTDVVVVTNPRAPELPEYLRAQDRELRIHMVEQKTPLGTAHAVRCALPTLEELLCTHVLILSGDVPNLRAKTLHQFIHNSGDGVGIITSILEDAKAYGRILRDKQGRVQAIVEAKDCSAEELSIREINSGIYFAPKTFLSRIIPRIGNDNRAAEYYLTDIVSLGVAEGVSFYPFVLEDAREGAGVNTLEELAAAQKFRVEALDAQCGSCRG